MNCPSCNSPGAYVGISTVECGNFTCQFYADSMATPTAASSSERHYIRKDAGQGAVYIRVEQPEGRQLTSLGFWTNSSTAFNLDLYIRLCDENGAQIKLIDTSAVVNRGNNLALGLTFPPHKLGPPVISIWASPESVLTPATMLVLDMVFEDETEVALLKWDSTIQWNKWKILSEFNG